MDDYDPNSILIDDALNKITKLIKRVDSYENIDLIDSHNRILYENIKSKIKVPNYDNSAMDGYAFNINDTKKNNTFKVVGSSLAGISYKGNIKKNECVKIMTGAVIPKTCNVVIMKEEIEYPIIFDATHSVQSPGGQGEKSGGDRKFVPTLSKAAVSAGIAGVFMETHDDPDNAPSDGPNMIDIKNLEQLLSKLLEIDNIVKEY